MVEKRVNRWVECAVGIHQKNYHEHVGVATNEVVAIIRTEYPADPVG